jgi:hypothetical protein
MSDEWLPVSSSVRYSITTKLPPVLLYQVVVCSRPRARDTSFLSSHIDGSSFLWRLGLDSILDLFGWAPVQSCWQNNASHEKPLCYSVQDDRCQASWRLPPAYFYCLSLLLIVLPLVTMFDHHLLWAAHILLYCAVRLWDVSRLMINTITMMTTRLIVLSRTAMGCAKVWSSPSFWRMTKKNYRHQSFCQFCRVVPAELDNNNPGRLRPCIVLQDPDSLFFCCDCKHG